MADRREMRTGIRKASGLLILLALAAIGLTACGSSDDDTTTATRPAVSATTADRLAKLSDRIASDLDAGDTCHAAHAADDLSAAVEDSDLPSSMRPGVETVATDLVNQVNCPPPPPPPEPEKKPKKDKSDDHGKGDKHGPGGDDHGPGDEHGQGGDGKPGNSGQGGFVPPGQAKLKGEEG
jgi:hypothetical protein